MLILTRSPGESIKVGNDVTITVLAVARGRQVRIGVAAPKSVPVHREEVFKRLLAERGETVDEELKVVE